MKIRKNKTKLKKGQLKIQVHKKSKYFLVPESSSKGQLKIQEMAFMLVALIIFFVLVGLFVLSIWANNLRESATEIAEQRALSAVNNLAGTAEFACPENKANCVDEDKLMVLADRESYKNFWIFTSLRVVKSSGFGLEENEMKKCNLGNYPKCDLIEIYDKKIENERLISSFVALCRRDYENSNPYEKCEIGKLIVGTEVLE